MPDGRNLLLLGVAGFFLFDFLTGRRAAAAIGEAAGGTAGAAAGGAIGGFATAANEAFDAAAPELAQGIDELAEALLGPKDLSREEQAAIAADQAEERAFIATVADRQRAEIIEALDRLDAGKGRQIGDADPEGKARGFDGVMAEADEEFILRLARTWCGDGSRAARFQHKDLCPRIMAKGREIDAKRAEAEAALQQLQSEALAWSFTTGQPALLPGI